jgi:DNA-binding MarR family transcriptional regulator
MGTEIAYSKVRPGNGRSRATEVKRPGKAASKAANPDVQRALELFMFAHLNLAADAEEDLTSLGFHRTHHRILYLVAGYPGTSVGDIISTLRLTAQAVQSPMRQLNEKGYIEQRYHSGDRRKRCLFITSKGQALVARLSNHQHRRLRKAFNAAGPGAVNGFLAVMRGMLTEDDRRFIERSSSHGLG